MLKSFDVDYLKFNLLIPLFNSMYHLTAMRQIGRFAGFSLHVSNTTDQHSWHLCYKDGPELPPLDFNTTCIAHGRYVIFYNERLPGKIYPMGYELTSVYNELCEVTVTGISIFILFFNCLQTFKIFLSSLNLFYLISTI